MGSAGPGGSTAGGEAQTGGGGTGEARTGGAAAGEARTGGAAAGEARTGGAAAGVSRNGAGGAAGDGKTGSTEPPRPSPHHLAELSGAFAMTASVHDPEPATEAEPHHPQPHPPQSGRPARNGDDDHDHDHHHDSHHHHHHHDEVVSERGLRGLVGGGASQVSVSAAMRARDAARPTDDDLAAADRDLQIIRRGWVPREELTRPGRRSPTS